MCPDLSNLKLSHMYELSETARMSIVGLFRQIVQQNPPIEVLNMEYFSHDSDRENNMGEIILESILSSNIDSINDLNLGFNNSWFSEDRSGNIDLLALLMTKQTYFKHINLAGN